MGYAVVREAITVKPGGNGNDLIYHLTRFVAEERIRPVGLAALLDYVRDGHTVVVWKLDRLGRNTLHTGTRVGTSPSFSG